MTILTCQGSSYRRVPQEIGALLCYMHPQLANGGSNKSIIGKSGFGYKLPGVLAINESHLMLMSAVPTLITQLKY